MDKLERTSRVLEAIDVDEAALVGRWRDDHVFAGTDKQEGFIVLAGKWNSGDADSCFVVFKIYGIDDGFGGYGIDYLDARSPVVRSTGIAKVLWWQDRGITVNDTGVIEELVTG